MPKLGPYAKEIRLGRVDKRSKEGRLVLQMRRALVTQLGGFDRVTPQQVALVERCAMLQLQLAKFDQRILEGGFTEYDSKVYLAFSNSLTRTMSALGIEAAAASRPSPTLDSVLSKYKNTEATA